MAFSLDPFFFFPPPSLVFVKCFPRQSGWGEWIIGRKMGGMGEKGMMVGLATECRKYRRKGGKGTFTV